MGWNTRYVLKILGIINSYPLIQLLASTTSCSILVIQIHQLSFYFGLTVWWVLFRKWETDCSIVRWLEDAKRILSSTNASPVVAAFSRTMKKKTWRMTTETQTRERWHRRRFFVPRTTNRKKIPPNPRRYRFRDARGVGDDGWKFRMERLPVVLWHHFGRFPQNRATIVVSFFEVSVPSMRCGSCYCYWAWRWCWYCCS